MPKEAPLQFEMFTGELVDNRTPRQKRLAKQREQPRQIEMFSQRDVAQFGVQARPKMPLPPGMTMALLIQDLRTPEEIERDRQKAAKARNGRMFEEVPTVEPAPQKPEAISGP